ncbi:Arm DNA-binding domain-containing protein [Delftia tsuruhatensis]|uniref:Arm DNA-binding domain-containing protein n=1 Tax=Delftia tsuruhatensis TaxID=180282 RepID=UPI00390895D4
MSRKATELGALAVSRLREPGLHAVGGVSGLYLQVTSSGARSWILRATVGGKRRDMGLGEILFRYEAPALADAANGALRRDAEH